MTNAKDTFYSLEAICNSLDIENLGNGKDRKGQTFTELKYQGKVIKVYGKEIEFTGLEEEGSKIIELKH